MSVINTNTISLNAQRNLATNSASLSTTIQRLSSGQRINSAKDDAAGLAISERFSTQIRGMNQAARNANDGISLAQTAEGSLGEIGNNLQRIRELAVQSRNATNSDTDRAALNAEVQLLKEEIGRVAQQTDFNGTKLLDGSFTNQSFQVGANQGQTIDIAGIVDANISQLGSWTSVATPASLNGAAAAGTGATTVPGGAAVNTTSGTSGAWGDSAASTAADQAFILNVGGVEVLNRAGTADGTGTGQAVTAADVDAGITTNAAALTGAGITVSGTAVGGDLSFSRADTNALAVTLTNTFGATSAGGPATSAFVATHNGTPAGADTTVPGGFAALEGDALTINGVNIEVGAATTGAGRASDLAAAINAAASSNSDLSGVRASVVDGALRLSSTSGDIAVGGTSDDLTALTGLTEGSTADAAAGSTSARAFVAGAPGQTGFDSLDISDVSGADNAILAMDAALGAVNSARADLGAIQNRFSSVVANLQTGSENLTASRSRIMDTDFAKETAELSRTQVLQQAGTAMLAQANQLPNNVLSLLR